MRKKIYIFLSKALILDMWSYEWCEYS